MNNWLLLFYLIIFSTILFRLYYFYSNQKIYQNEEVVNFKTQVLTTPKVYFNYQTVYVNLDKTTKVLIKTAIFPQINYGDYLKISGTLKSQVLGSGSTIFTLNYPKIEADFRENSSVSAIGLIIRNKITRVFQSNLDPVEDQFVSNIGKIDVLKIPHYGSKTGLSEYFLKTSSPKLAVISVGVKNYYGHPAKETLRTDVDREVEIVSDGNSFKLGVN